MLRNYFKTAIRNLTRNKGFAFLNIFGLAVGIACTACICLWVENEISYDSNNLKKDRLYIVKESQQFDSRVFTHSSTPGLLGPSLKADIPAIANTCRVTEGQTSLLFNAADKPVFALGKYAEPSIFSMFTLPFAEGNDVAALSQPNALVITQKMAKKIFGTESGVIGKTVKVDNKQQYVVTGVLRDLPLNSTLQFEWLMPYKAYFDQNTWLNTWNNNSGNTYVELKPRTDYKALNKTLYAYIQQHSEKSLSRTSLFPMTDWHLYNDFENGKPTGGGQIEYVRLFMVIACIILFIACINFMNLATAQSEKRAREVGVRKVLGAGKKLLVFQFISEAMIMSVIAAGTATIIMLLALPTFSNLMGVQLSLGFDNPVHVGALILIALLCGVVAGSYPSFYLSAFNPVTVIKSISIKDSGANTIRKGLVITQFAASIILISSTIIVYQQIQFVKERKLGFDKDQLVEMDVQGDMRKNFNAIKQQLLSSNYVTSVAMSDHRTLIEGNNTSGFTWAGKPANSKVLVSTRFVNPEFIKTMGMKIRDGRDLNYTDTLKMGNVLITQSLEKLMGKGSAVGKIIRHENDTTAFTVVGVVDDYVYGDVYGKPDPVMFLGSGESNANTIYIRIAPNTNAQDAVAGIQNIIKANNPAFPVDLRFMDDQFNRLFSNEVLVGNISKVFAGLAIIISCIGLFGLAAYTAERRFKEIGIRKVLGASVTGIVTLLSKNFMQLIAISCLIAFPVAWWLTNSWLTKYNYRIDVGWWVFVAAGSIAIIIALVTISFQSVKAALAKPVKSLRSE
ncbi:ABC transporter permease [Mucilaginibacter auburnensis]|uniref:Putative permease n=1 Tax=Mucilaginibacter auburnensis TaxID=1457233 RepID=A0A2H9VLL8_9SPHI|nr:ABC transporter permease [Mucilaginibacter auburnensis]PJJ79230.1 putative permease [Mucilaginibacter auburnensis]